MMQSLEPTTTQIGLAVGIVIVLGERIVSWVIRLREKKNGNNSGSLAPAEWETRIFAQAMRANQASILPILKTQTTILERMERNQDEIGKVIERMAAIQAYKDQQVARGAGA